MAVFTITTSEEEQAQVIAAIKKLEGQTVPVSKIAQVAKMNPNRVRYILVDLLDLNKIKRTPTKAYNEHYIRYMYEVI